VTSSLFLRSVPPLAVAAAFFGAPLQAQVACETYVTKEGDTIGSISLAAYGELRYQELFNSNADVLRNNPSAPPAGTELRIPCEDGRITAASAAPVIEATAPAAASPDAGTAKEADSGAYRPQIRFVSGDDWVPFADPVLTGGGLFLRIATTALDRAGPEYRHSVGWVEDWESHIFVLLPNGAFDFATGWYDPNCDNLVNPSERTLYMCDNFLFSDPVYDSVFGFFSKPDNPYAKAETFADLAGARFCRAEGNLFHDLEEQGLDASNITISLVDEEDDCLEGLLDDRYDVASFEAQYAPILFAEMEIGDRLVQSARLSTIQTSVVLAYKGNPRSAAFIDHLNRGLAILRESEEWTEIVFSTLAEAEALEAAQ
jgi:polar amino acid transport system substrate-binding protein